MTTETNVFPLNHRVFQESRYLRVFDVLPDTSPFEHSILTYLGSLMPIDKLFTEHPVYPSIPMISRATKISESTVRKKILSLVNKGYVSREQVSYVNAQGKKQQSTNNYYITQKAFQYYDELLEQEVQHQAQYKRASGDSFVSYTRSPSPPPPPPSPSPSPSPSSPQPPREENLSPIPPAAETAPRDIFSIKAEVDRLVDTWISYSRTVVMKSDKELFLKEYIRIDGKEAVFEQRIKERDPDSFLTSQGKNLFSLFTDFDYLPKAKAPFVESISKVLDRIDDFPPVDPPYKKQPSVPKRRYPWYQALTEDLAHFFLRVPWAKKLTISKPRPTVRIPKDAIELAVELNRLIAIETDKKQRERLDTIRNLIPQASLKVCLELFMKHAVGSGLKKDSASGVETGP